MDNKMLCIDSLVKFDNNPFALYEGKRMDDMMDSISEYGIITPIIVRPHPSQEGKYEILSGHNRIAAAMNLGIKEVPAIINDKLTNEEAALIVTESNLVQRSFADLRHSERAKALKNHLDYLKDLGGQGKRNDLLEIIKDTETCAQVAHKSVKTKSREKVADQFALSQDTVRRYVRLSYLPESILRLVDEDRIKVTPAVELSYLSESELETISILCGNEKNIKISLKQAKKLRIESEDAGGQLTDDDIFTIIKDRAEKQSRTIAFSDEFFTKLEKYGAKSGDDIAKIVSYYLELTEKGEIAALEFTG